MNGAFAGAAASVEPAEQAHQHRGVGETADDGHDRHVLLEVLAARAGNHRGERVANPTGRDLAPQCSVDRAEIEQTLAPVRSRQHRNKAADHRVDALPARRWCTRECCQHGEPHAAGRYRHQRRESGVRAVEQRDPLARTLRLVVGVRLLENPEVTLRQGDVVFLERHFHRVNRRRRQRGIDSQNAIERRDQLGRGQRVIVARVILRLAEEVPGVGVLRVQFGVPAHRIDRIRAPALEHLVRHQNRPDARWQRPRVLHRIRARGVRRGLRARLPFPSQSGRELVPRNRKGRVGANCMLVCNLC